jgi:thiol:disulfide interchange protein DsbC
VQHGKLIGYTEDKRFSVTGEILDLRTNTDIGANVLKSFRKRQYDSLTESVRFKATREKLRVEVFFDINCPYCREMLKRTAEYNKAGISLDYILFPRAGGSSQSYFIAQGIYCAKNPPSSLADAMRGDFSATGVADTPCEALVKKNMSIASDLGVIGTPAILFPDGSMHFGILSPSELLDMADGPGG